METVAMSREAERAMRIEALRQQLPAVELHHVRSIETDGDHQGELYAITDENLEVIGAFTLDEHIRGTGNMFLRKIKITDHKQGRGYGKATYLALIKKLDEEGKSFKSGVTLSRSSKPIWDWLVANGLAKITYDQGVDEGAEHMHYSYTKYCII